VSDAADRPEKAALASRQRVALLVGATALVLCTAYAALGAALRWPAPESFFRAYLTGYTFWLGVSLGCMALLMLQYQTGGAWGLWLRPVLEAAAGLLPLLAVLFLPLALAPFLGRLWPWADPVTYSHLPEVKRLWFMPWFFLARAACYFLVWNAFVFLLRAGSRAHEAAGAPPPRRFRILGALGLGAYGVTVTGAAIDWTMSLDPEWWSTIYGAMVAVAQLLSGFAFAVLVTALLELRRPADPNRPPVPLRDFGSLLLAFTMLWAYMAFSQFLLIWAGNLPEETRWYVPRLNGGWQWAALAMVLFQFALPFLMLLSGDVKTNPRLLAGVAALSLATRFVEQVWITLPSFDNNFGDLIALEPALLVGIGGVWVSLFLWELRRRPLTPAPTALTGEALAHD
jgi:hypothetical protein